MVTPADRDGFNRMRRDEELVEAWLRHAGESHDRRLVPESASLPSAAVIIAEANDRRRVQMAAAVMVLELLVLLAFT